MSILLTLSAVLAVQQHSAPPPPPGAPQVRTRMMVMGGDGPGALDKDGDGQVSRDEFAAPMNSHFAMMDKDSDGRLSTEELTAGHAAMAGGDHNVMIMRHPGGPGDHGGEGTHRFEMRLPRHGGPAGAPGGHNEERTVVVVGGAGGHGPGGHGPAAHGEGGPGRKVEIHTIGGPGGGHDLDADDDGRISEAEFTNPLREAFTRMDADRSGFIEEGERGGHSEARVIVHRSEGGDHD